MRIILNYIDINTFSGGYLVHYNTEFHMSLRDMRIGEKGRIIGVEPGEECYRQKLLAMGLIPGTEFEIAHVAPLGDPVEIIVRGYALSLRRHEANILCIKRV